MKKLKQILLAPACALALFSVGCAGTSDSRSTGQVIDDTATHTKVKAALINDPVVSGTAINVDVEQGVVYLEGAVNGAVAKQKAEEIARGVDGVRAVENNLVVRTVTPDPNVEADVEIDADADVDADVDGRVNTDPNGIDADVDADVDLD